MTRFVYVNGAYKRYAEAAVHAEDRGFQFADAIYEVIEVLDGGLVDATRHLARLERSLRELSIPPPMSEAALLQVIDQVIRPRMAYLSDLVADILRLSSDDERVLRCVLSIQSQCHAVMTSAVSRRFMPDLSGDSTAIDRLAQHIGEFSLGGIRSLKTA